MAIIEGTGLGHPQTNPGVPVAGTSKVATITIGGAPSGGTFTLAYGPFVTAPIPWNATNATLIAAVDSALEALASIGAAGVVVAAGTLTAGVGTMTVTWADKAPHDLLSVVTNAMTGAAPTVAVAETTPGVAPTGLGAPKGAKMSDTTNGIDYINTGTPTVPVWTKVGTQT